jgi:23S rRNA pseudouridine1911/1915/1917 synthase
VSSQSFASDVSGERLDDFLRRVLVGYSRAQVRVLLAAGKVRVDGQVMRTGRRLEVGARVTVDIEAASTPLLASPDLPLTVLFENSAVVVVDKPAGMPTLPLAPHERHTLANALVARYPELRDVGGSPLEAGLLHRLDNDTSGLLVAARTPEAYRAFAAQFKNGEVAKGYLALVHGAPPDAQVIDWPVGHDPRRPEAMRVVRPGDPGDGRDARTEVRVLERVSGGALVQAVIRRGARHQIRVHLAASGCPIAGDRLYGPPGVPRPVERHFLHAATVRLAHPVSGEPIELEAPLPEELQRWLEHARVRGIH